VRKIHERRYESARELAYALPEEYLIEAGREVQEHELMGLL
jgi:hypothetical protein